MYSRCLKRVLDFCCAFLAIVCLSPILVVLTVLGAIKMKGNPFFTQPRPGLNEKIFKLVKFRTMTNEKDANGNLLPDDVRQNAYGRFLRSTSLDELPELFNILRGDMAVIGPRPQLVRDMVFMTAEQRRRHTVRQGLSGLAQVNGRNAVTWETKIGYDLEYIKHIIFLGDALRWAARRSAYAPRRHALFYGSALRRPAAPANLVKRSFVPRFQAQDMTAVGAPQISAPGGHDRCRGCAPRNILQLGRATLHAERRISRTASYAGVA